MERTVLCCDFGFLEDETFFSWLSSLSTLPFMDMLDVLMATAGCEFPLEVTAAGAAFWDGAAFCWLDLLLALLLFFFP